MKERKFNCVTNPCLSLHSAMSFPPFKSCQCSFLIKHDFLNLACKNLHQWAPPRHPFIPVLTIMGWPTLALLLRPSTPHCPSQPTPLVPALHTLTSYRGQSDVILAPAIDKFHIYLLISTEMTLLICPCLRKSAFRY